MARRNFAEILKGAKIDLAREYTRLFNLFYKSKNDFGHTLYTECENEFLSMSFRGTCVTLEDFNEYYGFNFVAQPNNFDLDYLVEFCEYSYNLLVHVRALYNDIFRRFYIQQFFKVLELIDHELIHDDETYAYILVPKNQEAIAVAEIVDEKIEF